jgi:hypothetical protein
LPIKLCHMPQLRGCSLLSEFPQLFQLFVF